MALPSNVESAWTAALGQLNGGSREIVLSTNQSAVGDNSRGLSIGDPCRTGAVQDVNERGLVWLAILNSLHGGGYDIVLSMNTQLIIAWPGIAAAHSVSRPFRGWLLYTIWKKVTIIRDSAGIEAFMA